MQNQERPNPDALLKMAQAEAEYGQRGRLKIFFGACAGVGKTYAMLSAAHEKIRDGVAVLAGVVETHGRPETLQLLKDIPQLPPIEVEHRGLKLQEFDLIGALNAHPPLILIDELAHTNVQGLSHAKRWMDVKDLLNARIDVYTTLNVQHLESLNDLVASSTGIRMKETVPDAFFDEANDIVLIDIPSDELLQRLKEGKIYITDMGKKRATENFFRRENLIALRQLALRCTTERVDALHDIYSSYARQRRRVSERIGVCIGTDDLTSRLLRSAKRMVDSMNASWVALYVENTRHYRLDRDEQVLLEHNMHLAEQLGGKTEILHGENAATTIMDYARRHGITKIIVGKMERSRWREWLYGSLANRLIRHSGNNIDVYVITWGEETPQPSQKPLYKQQDESWQGYLFALAASAAATVLSLPLKSMLHSENFIMLYLVGIILTAARYGWKASIAASSLSFLCYNFFFTQPYYTFLVNDYHDVLTLAMLLVTGVLAGAQTSKLHAQSVFFKRKEHNTAALYAMSHQLAATRERSNMVKVILEHLESVFDVIVTIWLPDPNAPATLILVSHPDLKKKLREEEVAWWVYERKQPAGMGTTTLPGAKGYYIPLLGSTGKLGVLGITPKQADRSFTSEERSLLETFGSLAATALERTAIADLAEKRKVEAEGEKLRNALLSSVSHDLRTPLASIKGAISSLLMDNTKLKPIMRKDLLNSARDEVARLEHIISNLLDMTLLESGKLSLKKDYYFIPELVGNALKQTKILLESRKVHCRLQNNMPAIQVDGLLIEQVLVNLLENAAKYTPAGTDVIITAKKMRKNRTVLIIVEDQGPGIPAGEEERIFDKFYTTGYKNGHKGSGIGLAICWGIVHAHNGTIKAQNRGEGGAAFRIILPVGESFSSEILEAT